MPDLNPFDAPLKELEKKIFTLNQQKSTILKEIRWFESNDEKDLRKNLDSLLSQLKQLRNKCSEAENKITTLLKQREKLKPKIRTIFNPKNWFNWFAEDQIRLRRRNKELRKAQKAAETEKQSLLTQIAKVSQDADNAKQVLDRYLSFDITAHRNALGQVEEDLRSSQLQAGQIARRKESVDLALKPVMEQLRQYEEKRREAEYTLNRAKELERELTYADNSYERAMVHGKCEAEFNVGSPRKVIAKAEHDLRRINRDNEKVRKRAIEISQKAARRIDRIVIDGINLCYDNEKFIGLAALETLIPIIQNKFEVIVVFDAAIRRMTKLNDKKICKKLGGQVQVHVVATNAKADETVLDLAESGKHTYVLSNDRFGEYNDKRTVREGRVLRHEIVNGRILIHDLGVNAEYHSR